MTTYRLERLAAVDLVFDGELLSEESSHEPSGPKSVRWQEVRVYLTDNGKWVVERTGKSLAPGEVDRPSVAVCTTPAEVRQAMTFRHQTDTGQRRSYVTDICYDALVAAAARDPRLDEALAERV